jgi:hypothetical protein
MKKCAKTVHITTWLLVLQTLQHHYIQCTNADFLNFSSTNILVQYKNQNVSSTTPTQLNAAYSISWSERKRK